MLTQTELQSQLHYNPETGIFTWIKPHKYSSFKPNTITGINPDSAGYPYVVINSIRYYAHRLAWLYVYGKWPTVIDHINGDRSDNRISNLRECTQQQNSFNRKLSSRNKSGVKGISWSKQTKKWRIHISINGQSKYFGSYDDLEMAKSIIDKIRKLYHKEFANHG